MTDVDTTLKEIRARLRAMHDSLAGAPTEHRVEVGNVLYTLGREIDDTLDTIKEHVRNEATKINNGDPGVVELSGILTPDVKITFPKPQLKWRKGVDPESLKPVLGDRFDMYVDTVTTYKPRPNAPSLIVKVASDDEKGVLLSTIEEVPGTPRVSFSKLK